MNQPPATTVARGTLRAFDSGSYTATVQLDGSLFAYLPGVPVSRAIPTTAMVPGSPVAVALFDPSNPADTMLIAVTT
ncbi:MAG: hypothetical protein ACYDAG_15345 [Chloroflexota bacterium]